MLVMTSSGGAHCAFSGLGGASPSGVGESGVNNVNAIHLPSGDQLSESGASSNSASLAVWPFCIQRTKSCGRPSSALETYAILSPLGDQRGEACAPEPVTNGVCAPDSVSIIQIELRLRSVMMSNDLRV